MKDPAPALSSASTTIIRSFSDPNRAGENGTAATWPSMIVVDESADLLFRWDGDSGRIRWARPLSTKCRSLQLIDGGRVLAVNDFGFLEIDTDTGAQRRTVVLASSGNVISAYRSEAGTTLVAGLGLAGKPGIAFVEYAPDLRRERAVTFPGDYVRRTQSTPEGTFLFPANDRVCEGDWSGRILREFSAPGFRHAWKAVRLSGGTTLIAAGYGAFVAEFAPDGQVLRRWSVERDAALVRPNFFSDFTLLPDGRLVVCNWLGHDRGLGGSGYPFLEFGPDGALDRGWQDAAATSSPQTFVFV